MRTKKFSLAGYKRWFIAEGWIPATSDSPEPEMVSHETACVLNVSAEDEYLKITIFYADREPGGPYRITVSARRTKHIGFNDLKSPEPIPRATDYSTMIESNVPVIVQHIRLDSRQAANALMTTMAFTDVQAMSG
jgi:hypothetical protein